MFTICVRHPKVSLAVSIHLRRQSPWMDWAGLRKRQDEIESTAEFGSESLAGDICELVYFLCILQPAALARAIHTPLHRHVDQSRALLLSGIVGAKLH